jgi:hypothetical protein
VLHVVGGRLDEVAAYTPDARTLASTPKAAWRLPLKLFEYMAAWRPIIASDLPRGRDRPGRQRRVLLDPTRRAAWRRAVDPPRYDRTWGGRSGAARAELRGLPTRQARARGSWPSSTALSPIGPSSSPGRAGYLATPGVAAICLAATEPFSASPP